MTTRAIQPRWCNATILSAAALALALITGGCGSAKPSSHVATLAASAAALCGPTQTVSRAQVVRLDADPGNHPNFAFPARVTISDPRQGEAVAKAICALPLMPGKRYCPNDNGVSYRITFTGDSGAHVVNIQASGCREVRGLGPVRWALTKPAFWNVLGTAMGLKDAANSTFTGQ